MMHPCTLIPGRSCGGRTSGSGWVRGGHAQVSLSARSEGSNASSQAPDVDAGQGLAGCLSVSVSPASKTDLKVWAPQLVRIDDKDDIAHLDPDLHHCDQAPLQARTSFAEWRDSSFVNHNVDASVANDISGDDEYGEALQHVSRSGSGEAVAPDAFLRIER